VEEVIRFVDHLEAAKLTNALALFHRYEAARGAQDCATHIGTEVAILQNLRDGRTNSALELLEGSLNYSLIGLAERYKELGAPQRETYYLKMAQLAREYRAKCPFKSRYPEVDQRVAEAFNTLGQRSAK
jgi:hypothetical protein